MCTVSGCNDTPPPPASPKTGKGLQGLHATDHNPLLHPREEGGGGGGQGQRACTAPSAAHMHYDDLYAALGRPE